MRIPHLLAAAALLAVVCTPPAAAQTADDAARTWSYVGPNGPEHWGGLPGFARCGNGTRQSPVNLTGDPAPRGVTMTFPVDNPGLLLSKGYTVDLYLARRGTLSTADSTFDLQEVHFHVPAEHTVAGHRYAAEIHAVYQAGTRNRAVLTTFVEAGDANGAWTTLIRNLPGNEGNRFEIGVVDLRALLSLGSISSERMYMYAGSLTTPACEENVRFLIRERTINLSQEQIDALSSAMPRNVRPVQRSVPGVAP